MSNRYYVYLIALIASLGGLLFGFDTGVISGALIFLQKSFALSIWHKEIVVSCIVLGALFGAIASGQLTNYFGRRKMLIVAATGFIAGTLMASFAVNLIELIIGRFVVGLSIGISSYTTPLFISEMAPPKHRGGLVLLNGIMITGGEAAAFFIDYLLVPTHSWRLMFIMGLVPAVALLIGMIFLPATPRWLVLKGYFKKAKINLRKLQPNSDINQAFNDIVKSLSHGKNSWSVLFGKKIRPVLWIGLGLGILQQFVGINTVMYYGPFIFKAAGFSDAGAQVLATLGMGIVNTMMTIVAVFIIDKVGRRALLTGGSFCAMLSLFAVGLIFYFHLKGTYIHGLMMGLMMLYIASYCISIGSLFWLIIAEIYPLHIRGIAMGFVTAIQWLANFIVAATFLSILHYFGAADTFSLYAIMCLLTCLFSYYLVPETKGVSLEEIEANIEAGKPSRELGLPVKDKNKIDPVRHLA